jgi:uncharacterized damage-inducible protein DinB
MSITYFKGLVMNIMHEAYEWNTSIAKSTVKELAEESLKKRFEGSNSIHWLVGHLALCRRMICGFIDLDLDEVEWKAQFDMGSSPELPDDCPSPGALLEDYTSIGEKMCARLKEMTPDEFEKLMKFIVSEEERTVMHNLQFMYWHESYHIGQIAMVARILGCERMA